jgi:hypothetical protein
MVLTLQVPDELADRLRSHEEDLPQILEMGLRELSAGDETGFKGIGEILETLAGLPTPEEVLALKASPTLQRRVNALLEKNREQGLTAEEEREWARYEYMEHLVRMAKAQAKAKLMVS